MQPDRKGKGIDQQIDENLKRAFSDVASEPIPDRFTKLLEQLKSSNDKRPDDRDAHE